MFIGIKRISRTLNGAEGGALSTMRVVFEIRDTCFVQNIELFSPATIDSVMLEASAILHVYNSRKLNAARNLAIYYLTQEDGISYMAQDVPFVDKLFPTLGYGTKTYFLVQNYYHIMNKLLEDFEKQNKK